MVAKLYLCQQPYNVENTGMQPSTKVIQHVFLKAKLTFVILFLKPTMTGEMEFIVLTCRTYTDWKIVSLCCLTNAYETTCQLLALALSELLVCSLR